MNGEGGKLFGNRHTSILKLWYFGLNNNTFRVHVRNSTLCYYMIQRLCPTMSGTSTHTPYLLPNAFLRNTSPFISCALSITHSMPLLYQPQEIHYLIIRSTIREYQQWIPSLNSSINTFTACSPRIDVHPYCLIF